MPQRYTTKSGKVMMFPDDATPDEIQAAADEADGVQTKTGSLMGAVGKGVLQGIGYAPAKAAYDVIKGVWDDPAGALPMAGGQLGAIGGGMAIGSVGGPVGTAIGGIGGAILGGGAGKGVENVIKARPVTEGMGEEAAMQGAFQAIPGAATVLGKGANALGRKMVRSAFRPLSSMVSKQAGAGAKSVPELQEAVVDTVLRERVNATPRGFVKLHRKIDAIDDATAGIEAGSTKQIDPAMVATRVDDTRSNLAWQTNPQADQRMLNSVESRWRSNPKVSDPITDDMGNVIGHEYRPISVGDAQNIKRGEYRKLKKDYGDMKSAEVEGRKALARGLREEVMEAEPALQPLLKRESELITASDVLERTLSNAGIANPVKLYELLGGISGNIPAILLGTFSRPGPLSQLGRGSVDMGRMLSQVGQVPTPAMIRAAILGQMTEGK